MIYTGINIIREESGFTNNDDIVDETIQEYVNEANGYIRGVVASVYDVSEMESDASFKTSQAFQYLRMCERLLAAGLLMNKEYGNDEGTQEEGLQRITRAEEMLRRLRDNNMPVKLINASGVEYTTVASGMAGSPTLTGVTDGDYEFDLDDEY